MTLEKYIERHSKTQLIFDFDATLFLLLLPWERWGEDIRHKLINANADIWDALNNQEINISQMQNLYVEHHDQKILDEILRHNEKFETEQLRGWDINHGLLELIRSFGPNYTKHLWSSNTRKVIETVLVKEGMMGEFNKIVTRNDVRMIKPNSEGFRLIYDSRIKKSEYLMIGDSRADAGAAKSAGIDFYKIDFFGGRL